MRPSLLFPSLFLFTTAIAGCTPAPVTPVTAPGPSAAAPPAPALPAAPPSAPAAAPSPAGKPDESEPEDPDTLPDVSMTFDVRIPMHDGVTLSATIYRPASTTEKLPVVYSLTPYTADTNHAWAVYLAKRGYVSAAVDIRGRGNSGGEFDPWHPHAGDLRDVVEWFAQQPWSNGKVAMMGGSYLGMTQWWTARELPPHLTTIVPIASVGLGVDFPFTNNIAYPYDARWLAYVAGHTKNSNVFGDDELWRKRCADFFAAKLPFRTLDTFLGVPSRAFQQALAHPVQGDFWESSHPTPAQLGAMRQPILTITGHYDGDQPGALDYYRQHQRYGAPEVVAEHYLVIGPWDHAGTREPKADMGGVHFGTASVVDVKKLVRGWYDWRMKGAKKPSLLADRVAYYVPGEHAEKWKYAPTLDGVTKSRARYFLGSLGGVANDVFRSGTLSVAPPDVAYAGPDHYVYDPRDVSDAERTRSHSHEEDWVVSQDGLGDLRGASVVYHSEPLAEELELAGNVRLSVWLAMDVPDTDLRATLYEITRDGKSILLTSDVQRARYRESLTKESLVPSGIALQYDFARFPWFARRVGKGSRLRLHVGAVNSAQTEKNYGSGGVVADETGKDARTAHVTVLHDAEHPSALDLPLGR